MQMSWNGPVPSWVLPDRPTVPLRVFWVVLIRTPVIARPLLLPGALHDRSTLPLPARPAEADGAPGGP